VLVRGAGKVIDLDEGVEIAELELDRARRQTGDKFVTV
jgi:hypothetical protein